MERALRNSVQVYSERVHYVALNTNPNMAATGQRHFFSIDNEMVYWNFYLDFGPLNLAHVYRFCLLLNSKLKDPKLQDKLIYFYSAEHPHKRTNAVFLICAWLLLCKGKSPEEAFAPFKGYYLPFPPWHDATPTACHFNLTILDTLRGLYRAREHKFFDFHHFNVEEYEHFEQVENGDLNWCMEGRFVAFAGPHDERKCSPGGYYNLQPEDYIPYFKKRNVTLVVRCNKPYYDAKKFTAQGISHMELYFIDGSNPPEHILNKFITRCEETTGAIAVHCKAGLGRTGTLIGCYMMKHFRLTAEEVIGWLRIVRPGSIIGPQQQFMKDMQMKMWREGELMRAKLHQPILTTSPMEKEETDNNKVGALVSPSSITSRFSSNNITATATSSGTGSHGSTPSTPNSLARRLNRVSIGTPTSATSSPSATTAAVNASSGKAEREGRETQGDLLRMRRAQAMMGAHTASPSTLSVSSPSSSNNPRSPSTHTTTHTTTTPTTSHRIYNHHTPTSTTRPDSRSSSGIKPSPTAVTAAGTRSSFGNFLGFNK